MIAKNIASLRQHIAAACRRAGREISSVSVVCVSKGRDTCRMREALAAGMEDFGESRVQEASLKHHELPEIPRWHLIGHLQTNKVRDALAIFDLIHSVDSLRLAGEIDTQAGRIAKVQDILIEVNVSGEKSKYGIPPSGLEAFMEGVRPLTRVRIRGLMCMAPASRDPEAARPYFRALRMLRDDFRGRGNSDLQALSMGMSDDFEIAVEEGATMVRLGRAIFE